MSIVELGHFKSDTLENWVNASYRMAKGNHAKGIAEIQGVGQVHIALRKFELSWMSEDGLGNEKDPSVLDLSSPFHLEVARQWVIAAFSLAYKIERGDVFQKRETRDFKRRLNPLRNVFEKGHVDGRQQLGCFPDTVFNQSPYRCLAWVVPDKNLDLVEFYRVEIAEALIEICMKPEVSL